MLSSGELSRLWQQHAAALLLFARGHCRRIAGAAAEDCVQEAFIRLARQENVPDVPAAWLVTVVRNIATDSARAQLRRADRETLAARERPLWFEPSGSSALVESSAAEIQQALQDLEDVTRDIVVAHIWNGMTFRQIADAFDMSHATVHRRYELGIEQLRAMMVDVARDSTPVSTQS